MRKKVIVGNWKMNHTRANALAFVEGMKEEVKVYNPEEGKAIKLTKDETLGNVSLPKNVSINLDNHKEYEKFKISPLNFITKQKIERAKEIIEIEDLPISEVASICGFENTSYFIKQFKKLTGITPKEYKSRFFK